jgi:hypothetical protein
MVAVPAAVKLATSTSPAAVPAGFSSVTERDARACAVVVLPAYCTADGAEAGLRTTPIPARAATTPRTRATTVATV